MARSLVEILTDADFESAMRYYLRCTKLDSKSKWYDVCKQIAEVTPEVKTSYIFDDDGFTIVERVSLPRVKRSYQIEVAADNLLDDAKEKCYLFRFFNAEGERLCSKVGTTKRTVIARLKEELSSSTYQKMGATSAIIDRVYGCGDTPAEGLESYFRAEYIKLFPNSFKKNDRFINEDFDLDKADMIANEYLNKYSK